MNARFCSRTYYSQLGSREFATVHRYLLVAKQQKFQILDPSY